MLKARVVTALFLVAGFAAVLFFLPTWAASLMFSVVAALAGWEWAGLLKARAGARYLFGGLIFVACLVLQMQPAGFPLLWIVAALFWLMVMPFWLKRRWAPGPAGYMTGLVLLLPTWAALVDLHGRSPWLLLAVMALVWVADIAAYFAGRAFGKHKLAPAISPGKTWEGVAGAVLGVIAYGIAVSGFLPQTQEIGKPILAASLLFLTGLSIAGDLFESMIKRQAGMKDSSQLLPGHGGILDRIDSQTSTLPLVALCLYWMSR
jgi:phosphatidate cytidylyltransferase